MQGLRKLLHSGQCFVFVKDQRTPSVPRPLSSDQTGQHLATKRNATDHFKSSHKKLIPRAKPPSRIAEIRGSVPAT